MAGSILWLAKSISTSLALANHVILPFDCWIWDLVKLLDLIEHVPWYLVVCVHASFFALSMIRDFTKFRHENLFKLCMGALLYMSLLSEDAKGLQNHTRVLIMGIVSGLANGIILQSATNLSLRGPEKSKLADLLALVLSFTLKILIVSQLKIHGVERALLLPGHPSIAFERYLHWRTSAEFICAVLKSSLYPPSFLHVSRQQGVRVASSNEPVPILYGTLRGRADIEASGCNWCSLFLVFTALRFIVQCAAISGGPVGILVWVICVLALSWLQLLSEAEIRISGLLGISAMSIALVYRNVNEWVELPQFHPIALLTAASICWGVCRAAPQHFEGSGTILYPLAIAAGSIVLFNVDEPHLILEQLKRLGSVQTVDF